MNSQSPVKNKNADGLRGIACLAVVLHHFVGAFLPYLLHHIYPESFAAKSAPSLLVKIFSSPAITLFYNGGFPVMIFFVLSGYVLATPYYNHNSDPTVLHRRLWGRYFRFAIPVAASILISFVIYQCHGYFNIPAAEISGSTGSTSWLYTCFRPGLSYITLFKDMLWRSLILGEGHFNPVCWSLKAEFIGSIYLLLFYIAKPRGYNALLLLLVMLLMYILDNKTPIFLYAILSGSLLNIITIPKKFYLFLLLLGLFFGAFQYENAIYNLLPSVTSWDQRYFYNTLGALLVTAPIVHGFGIRFFQSQLLQFLGTISFPLYLLHFLVLCSFSCWLYLLLPNNGLMLFLNFLFYLFVAISISILFEKYVDQPAIRFSHRFSSFLFKKTPLQKHI